MSFQVDPCKKCSAMLGHQCHDGKFHHICKIQVLEKQISALQAENERFGLALEAITVFTKKGHDAFASLVSGAIKMDEIELIDYAPDASALSSLVYKTADRAIKAKEKA